MDEIKKYKKWRRARELYYLRNKRLSVMKSRAYGRHIAIKCENKINALIDSYGLSMTDAERDALCAAMAERIFRSIAIALWEGCEVYIAKTYNRAEEWWHDRKGAGFTACIHLLNSSCANKIYANYRGHGDYKSLRKNAREQKFNR